MCNERIYLHLFVCVVMDGRKRRGRPGILPAFFVFFLHPVKGHLQLFLSTFFSATGFPRFCNCFFCFAVCHKEWSRAIARGVVDHKDAVNTILPRSPVFCFLYPKISTVTNINKIG